MKVSKMLFMGVLISVYATQFLQAAEYPFRFLEKAEEKLGVSATAPAEEIRKVWHARALATHTDKGGDADEFNAYRVASELVQRANRSIVLRSGRGYERHTTEWAACAHAELDPLVASGELDPFDGHGEMEIKTLQAQCYVAYKSGKIHDFIVGVAKTSGILFAISILLTTGFDAATVTGFVAACVGNLSMLGLIPSLVAAPLTSVRPSPDQRRVDRWSRLHPDTFGESYDEEADADYEDNEEADEAEGDEEGDDGDAMVDDPMGE